MGCRAYRENSRPSSAISQRLEAQDIRPSVRFNRSTGAYFHSSLHPVIGWKSKKSQPNTTLASAAVLRKEVYRSHIRPKTRPVKPFTSARRPSSAKLSHIFRKPPEVRHREGPRNAISVSGTRPVTASSTTTSNTFVVPSDGIIFADSPEFPGLPIVYRTASARAKCPDRLNLDKRSLSVCPVVEGEMQVRLLNYQDNEIREISNLANLPNLIYLDLYSNEITEIVNLGSLKGLRVLLIGKNRIKKLQNLQWCLKLDVLDVQHNLLQSIDNVNCLKCLRVLNVSGKYC